MIRGQVRSRGRGRQKGIALVMFAAGALAIIGIVGLVLDMGMAYLTKTRLQNALDAAALDGAKTLNLNFDAGQATTVALASFAGNMGGTGLTPVVETSPTLTPFAPGGANPRFLRVSVSSVSVTMRLARALPGMDDSAIIGGSAVAGPIPLGQVCGAVPVALCGQNTDANCTDGACFGYTVGAETEIEFKGDNSSLGPGNYGLVELSCGTGADCVRDSLAGSDDSCFSPGDTRITEPGVSSGPTTQGLNTRFGQYSGPVTPAEYPPDNVTAHSPLIYYNQYRNLLANEGSWNYPAGVGVAQRRVVLIPVIDCSTPINGTKSVNVLGSMCVFLTQPAGGSKASIFGQVISQCEAQGSVSETPGGASGAYKIILYKDPGATLV